MNTINLLGIFLLAFVNYGECIKCFNCVSKDNDECRNPVGKLQPQECSLDQINALADQTKQIAQNLGNMFGVDIPPATEKKVNVPIVCQKVVTSVGNDQLIVRGCQLSTGVDKFCDNAKGKADSVITHCSHCDMDGCNSGNWLQPTSFLAVALFGLWTLIVA